MSKKNKGEKLEIFIFKFLQIALKSGKILNTFGQVHSVLLGKKLKNKYDICINNYTKLSIKYIGKSSKPSIINHTNRTLFIQNISLCKNNFDIIVLDEIIKRYLVIKSVQDMLLCKLLQTTHEKVLLGEIIKHFLFCGSGKYIFSIINQVTHILFFVTYTEYFIFSKHEFNILYEAIYPHLIFSLRTKGLTKKNFNVNNV